MAMTGGRGRPSSVGKAADPRRLIMGALVRNRGIVYQAAVELGIDRNWLYYQIEKLELWPAVKELRRRKREARQHARHTPAELPGDTSTPVI